MIGGIFPNILPAVGISFCSWFAKIFEVELLLTYKLLLRIVNKDSRLERLSATLAWLLWPHQHWAGLFQSNWSSSLAVHCLYIYKSPTGPNKYAPTHSDISETMWGCPKNGLNWLPGRFKFGVSSTNNHFYTPDNSQFSYVNFSVKN